MELKIRFGANSRSFGWCDVYLLCLAFSVIVSMTQLSSQISSLFSYLGLFCGFMMVCGNKEAHYSVNTNRRLRSRIVACFVLTIILVLVSYLLANSSDDITSYGRAKSLIVITLHCIVAILGLSFHIEFRKIYRFFYIMSIGGIIVYVSYYGINNVLASFTTGVRLGAEIIAINLTGMAFAMFSLFFFYMILKTGKYRAVNILLFFTSVLFCASTFSRGALLAIIIGILFLLFFSRSEHKWKLIFGSLIVFMFLLIFLNRLGVYEILFERIATVWTGSDNAVAASDAGRIRMMQSGFEIWKKYPIFGCGFNNFSKVSGINTYAHNNYIQILSELGILGFTLIYFPKFAIAIKLLKKAIRKKSMDYTFMFTLVVVMMFCDMSIVSYYNLILNIAYIFSYAIVFTDEIDDGRNFSYEI